MRLRYIMKKFLSCIILCTSTSFICEAQAYPPFRQIVSYTKSQVPNKYDSSLHLLTNRLGVDIHYLYPFYQALGWEKKFKESMGEKAFNSSFSEMLAFAGDYKMAISFAEKNYDSLSAIAAKSIIDTINSLKDIQAVSAKNSIIGNAPYYQVMMINESHNKPVHRAFTYSLLEGLYKQGYRYLAMEALNNFSNQCLDSLNVFTGYYTYEPVAGELVRKALELGYKLVSYEDTLASKHTISQRDSIQAENIFSVIKKDPSAKILVHAGYTHISKELVDGYTPMACWFKKISGIDPFTIDQTGMTEGSEFEYGRVFYDYFNTRFTIKEPSVIFQNKRSFNPLEEKGYDLLVMHPPTTYVQDRSAWLSFENERKPVLIQPTEKMLFMVQAYYENEYNENLLSLLVPADQTYTSNREGYYCLFLKKGTYKIVMRDVTYKILSVKDQEVK